VGASLEGFPCDCFLSDAFYTPVWLFKWDAFYTPVWLFKWDAFYTPVGVTVTGGAGVDDVVASVGPPLLFFVLVACEWLHVDVALIWEDPQPLTPVKDRGFPYPYRVPPSKAQRHVHALRAKHQLIYI
jgi:hypothetical protein